MNIAQVLLNLWETSGLYEIFGKMNWQSAVMIAVSCVLLYLGIVKQFEPLLLIGIAFGMLLTNLPLSGVFTPELWLLTAENTHINYGAVLQEGGLIDILYLGVKLGVYPSLIFIGVGAMTDFGPLISNPKSLILGAAAQLGIFTAFLLAIALGFTGPEAASIGIIGGADGPTAIWLTKSLAPNLLAPIAVAAYSYMALIPMIQPPFMKLLTTKEERMVKMDQARQVTKTEKIIFPIMITIVTCLILPSVAALLGCLMFGNLLTECGVTKRLSSTVQNELMNIVTIFLSMSVGATARGYYEVDGVGYGFLSLQTIYIIVLGLLAFSFSTIGGLLIGKIMYVISGKKINPLIGSAGVSAVPMAARVSQNVGAKYNPTNFLLMHAMGPNVAGVIGSAVAAGFLLAVFG